MNPGKEQELFCKRIEELQKTAFFKGYICYSDFMDLNQNSSLCYMWEKNSYQVSYDMWGGYEDAERKIAAIYADKPPGKEYFPISCIKISTVHKKYCDNLSHRDYLGAVLNLGITRAKLGDILIKEQDAYLFCMDNIADFITNNLTRVKHTNVCCSIQEAMFEEILTPDLKEIFGTVSNIRIDAVLAVAFRESRTKLSSLVPAGKAFVNGKQILSCSYILKPGDRVSLRGYGKFIFDEINGETKKNKIKIKIKKFI